ncbi:hypothetical protein [Tropicibacter sp. S64]|uniref:hypothetical protein n=1 Tax=Tropicibacter sp. S64 TaxID=3415122 RepID=UPI003C7B7CF7
MHAHPPRFTLAAPEAETGPDAEYTDLFEAIAGSEAEMSRRFDDMELAVMDLHHQLTAAPEDLDAAALPARLLAGLTRLGEGIAGLRAERAGLAARLDGLEDLLARGFDRLDRKLATARKRRRDEQDLLEAVRAALGALPQAQAQVPAPDPAAPQPGLAEGFDRMAGLLAVRDARLEEERLRLARSLGGLESLYHRLDAATRPASTAAPDALNARLTRIEETLAALDARSRADGTAEALRDLSMIVAERRLAPSGAEYHTAPPGAECHTAPPGTGHAGTG